MYKRQVQNLNKEKVSKIVLPCPRISEQKSIAEVLSDIDKPENFVGVTSKKKAEPVKVCLLYTSVCGILRSENGCVFCSLMNEAFEYRSRGVF